MTGGLSRCCDSDCHSSLDFISMASTVLPNLDGIRKASVSEAFAMLKNDRGEVTNQSFHRLCKTIFRDNSLAVEQISTLAFGRFGLNADGLLDESEFAACFYQWIEPILRPKRCLLVVDVQNDFISGSLALKNASAKQDGAEVIPVINRILSNFGAVFHAIGYTLDWHPPNHCSFVENVQHQELDPTSKVTKENVKPFDVVVIKGNPSFAQPVFPGHCIQNSPGAEFHPDLNIFPGSFVVRKGTEAAVDSFSGFFDNQKKTQTELDQLLTDRDITDVYICGLATDFCVGSTVLDALDLGYRTIVIEDACRGCSEEQISVMKDRMKEKGGLLVKEVDLPALLGADTPNLSLATQGFSDAVLARRLHMQTLRPKRAELFQAISSETDGRPVVVTR